jgi:hypothetical protein
VPPRRRCGASSSITRDNGTRKSEAVARRVEERDVEPGADGGRRTDAENERLCLHQR